ncbi:hypothetical protein N7532_007726 [Penicillium argentinense]|uniref:Uncharacterized protein n=1 Tax=Penicillium argentinense TaxID=1131581 RepID=A0A9W9K1U9_9EURO|nr:uncharacterized protein N7532_007726 [Penicillium argentinense]KAJ5089042.1 hypothetical protein N7532_007726 [Penicillium argentinense]
MSLPSVLTWLLVPLLGIYAMASAIPPVHDLVLEQQPGRNEQLPTPTPVPNLITTPSTVQIQLDSDRRLPTRNGDPYGLSDFGIDPAHVTRKELDALREAGAIPSLLDLESNSHETSFSDDESYLPDFYPLLKLCLLGATAVGVLSAMVHFKER